MLAVSALASFSPASRQFLQLQFQLIDQALAALGTRAEQLTLSSWRSAAAGVRSVPRRRRVWPAPLSTLPSAHRCLPEHDQPSSPHRDSIIITDDSPLI